MEMVHPVESWVVCHRMRDRAPLPLNFALAKGYVAFMGGTKIWLQGEDDTLDEIDVVETPEMIAIALNDFDLRLVSDLPVAQSAGERRVH